MTGATLTLGAVQVTAVCDVVADFPAPLERAFPGVEGSAWDPYRRRYPGAFSGRARYLIQRADWERFSREGDDDDRAAFELCVRPLRDLGVLKLLDGDHALSAELSLLHTPGHTPGSQSLLVGSGGHALLLWGDVANHPAQVDQPAWGPGSDLQQEVARATRRRLP